MTHATLRAPDPSETLRPKLLTRLQEGYSRADLRAATTASG